MMRKSLLLFLLLLIPASSLAYDFEVDGIYYGINPDGQTVFVTSYGQNGEKYYSGDLVIPERVSYNNYSYAVTAIGQSAFAGCSHLTNVTIPNSVTSIRAAAFSGCDGLTNITLPNSVTSVGEEAFWNCNSLTRVTLGQALTSIGEYAFYWCKALTDVNIPNSVTSIGDYAFCYCSGLKSVTIGTSVNKIGDGAFDHCKALASVIIPNSVTEIGEAVFLGCWIYKGAYPDCISYPFFNAAVVDNGIVKYPSKDSQIENGEIWSKDRSAIYFVPIDWIGKFNIPNTVTSIGASAFYGCENLTGVSIPSSVTSIGEHAFGGCRGLTSVTIPKSVTHISKGSFSTSGLTSVTIPNSITSIGVSAFAWCESLTNVTIPGSVTSIEDYAFYRCSALTSVNLLDGTEEMRISRNAFEDSPIRDVLIGCSMAETPFREISTLKTAWVTDIVNSIPANLFYHCDNLENVYIGDGVTKISDWAFSGCSSLKLFNFGKKVTEIGDNALSGCAGIANLYAEPMVPPTVANQGFDGINKKECHLHYPAGAPYSTTPQWNEFLHTDNNFVVTMPEETMTAEAGEMVTVTAVVDENVNPAAVVWRSSNPEIAEVVEVNATSAPVSRAAETTISAQVNVKEKAQVSIAVFLPAGQMSTCIINEGINAPGGLGDIEGDNITSNGMSASEYIVYTLQGVMVMRTFEATDLSKLHPGIYIVNGRKRLIK